MNKPSYNIIIIIKGTSTLRLSFQWSCHCTGLARQAKPALGYGEVMRQLRVLDLKRGTSLQIKQCHINLVTPTAQKRGPVKISPRALVAIEAVLERVIRLVVKAAMDSVIA